MKTLFSEKSVTKYNSFRLMLLTVAFSCLSLNTISSAEECLFAVQLKDPAKRSEYEEVIDAWRSNSNAPNDALDPVAMNCLSCHDGTLARAARYRISNGTLNQSKSIETIKGAHPLGMDYEKASWNDGYAALETLPAEMVLINGKVSCVTCHNLLGSNQLYHVVDNSRSGLCFSCHRK